MGNALEHFVANRPGAATILFFVMLVVSVVTTLLALVFWFAREVLKARLCAQLINQMECTRQAEKRSLNKSAAFAAASHDIRGHIGALTTLIELCYDHIPSGSEVEDNLRQMHSCADDLLSILNDVLDTSKVEAGKMELEEGEFNLAQLLEEVADFYHPTAMKKGVEVVLDPCDGTVSKFANVRGDRIKLKQIICNLVSNAVKFTSQGSISIRAWARKPSSETSMLVSRHQRTWLECIMFFKENDNGADDAEHFSTLQQNPNCIEFIIEVDDTGLGIPKDKRKSVFENFVQVKDNSLGHGGTGLGLGIVQSLVRLMGGDIEIVDKEAGKPGSIFKFNILLLAGCKQQQNSGPADGRVGDIEAPVERSLEAVSVPDVLCRHKKVDGSSLVVLLIHNSERRRVVKKYLERLGIEVSVVRCWEYLQGHLRKIKNTLATKSHYSTSEWTYSSHSDCISGRSGKGVPLSLLEGKDKVPCQKMNKGAHTFILFIIDIGAGPFAEMASVVEEFRRDLSNIVNSKIVWLDRQGEGLKRGGVQAEDAIMCKPLHGSRLHRVIRILPEFGGISALGNGYSERLATEGKHQVNNEISKTQEKWSSGSEEILTIGERRSRVEKAAAVNGSRLPPLTDLRILVAEDTPLLAALAYKILTMLGAVVHIVVNGQEALNEVVKGLREYQMPVGSSRRVPFDMILMDCEMPELNGFEATSEIRKAEKQYNLHIPIIALTAHISSDQIKETELAGMDGYLAKPLQKDVLVQTITRLGLLPGMT